MGFPSHQDVINESGVKLLHYLSHHFIWLKLVSVMILIAYPSTVASCP